jgi:hypothetical protein
MYETKHIWRILYVGESTTLGTGIAEQGLRKNRDYNLQNDRHFRVFSLHQSFSSFFIYKNVIFAFLHVELVGAKNRWYNILHRRNFALSKLNTVLPEIKANAKHESKYFVRVCWQGPCNSPRPVAALPAQHTSRLQFSVPAYTLRHAVFNSAGCVYCSTLFSNAVVTLKQLNRHIRCITKQIAEINGASLPSSTSMLKPVMFTVWWEHFQRAVIM